MCFWVGKRGQMQRKQNLLPRLADHCREACVKQSKNDTHWIPFPLNRVGF